MNKKLIFGGFAGILVLTVFFFQTQKETTIGLKVADHAARKIATTIAAVSNDFAQKDYTYKNT
ncbi:MAG: hypothetical protein HON90_09485, partial [Halobacteriovoraceae bacterium]|nr:hypothetical protein [Halobacteriovoraceae bacterium]